MSEPNPAFAIETSGLSFRYPNGAPVLRQIDLRVPAGSIYGFLGPNGAGKTTTLRLLLGLLPRQQGEIRVLGRSLETHRIEILSRVGSLIESPSLYAHLTAAENLEVWRLIYRTARQRVGEVLDLVGLADTGRKRVGQFSLGMRQRLAVAIAMLHDPAVLVLDEPTNGLDPHGMVDTRELLLRLNRERGVTIVVSSHLLAEIEKFATHVGIIDQGVLRFQGTLNELGARRTEPLVVLDTDDNPRAVALLVGDGVAVSLVDGKVVLGAVSTVETGRINGRLAHAGIGVFEISRSRQDLEAIFMAMITDSTS